MIIFSLPPTLLSGYSSVLDSTVRVYNSGPFVESNYFWWTSLTYLPAYFFLVLFCTLALTQPVFSTVRVLTLAPLLILYLTELQDFTPLSVIDQNLSYGNCSLNSLLTNGLNKYHPLIFYVSVVVFLTSSLNWAAYSIAKAPFSVPISLSWLVKEHEKATLVNLIALFLGSWWALQEGTWGGWWNWDSSETFGLEVSLVVLVARHSPARVLFNTSMLIRHSLLTFLFISSYFFIQLNFELVSHNFGSKFFFFFNNNLFSLEMIFILFIWFCNLAQFWQRISLSRTLLGKTVFPPSSVTTTGNRYHPIKLTLWVTVLSWIFWSYRPLLNYFSWNFLGINVLNSENSLQSVSFAFALLALTCFYRSTQFVYLGVFLHLTHLTNWLWIFIFVVRSASLLGLSHLALCGFSLFAFTISEVSVYNCFTVSPYSPFMVSSAPVLAVDTSLTLDALTIEISRNDSTLLNRLSQNWNLLTASNVPSINFFSLVVEHLDLKNHYNLGSSYSTILLVLDLVALSVLPICFFVGLSLTIWSSLRSPFLEI